MCTRRPLPFTLDRPDDGRVQLPPLPSDATGRHLFLAHLAGHICRTYGREVVLRLIVELEAEVRAAR